MKVVIIPGFTDHPEGRAFADLSTALTQKGYDLIKIAWPNIPDNLKAYNITNTLNYARDLLKNEKEDLAILGFSMGGIITTILATEFNTKKLGLIVSPYQAGSDDDLDGKYKEWKEMGFRKVKSSRFGDLTIPFSFLEDARKYNALDYIDKVNCPKLFVVAGSDERISLIASQKLYAKANDPKIWKLISGSQHKYQYQEENLQLVNKIIIDFIQC